MSLRQQLTEKAFDLLGLRDPREIETHIRQTKDFIDEHYARPAVAYSTFKKLFREQPRYNASPEFAWDLLNTIMKQTPEELKASQQLAQEQLEKKLEEVNYFDPNYVMWVLHSLDTSADLVDEYVCLQLQCGARQRDIFDEKKCTFTQLPPNSLLQHGSSKKVGPFILEKRLITCESWEFMRRLERFRAVMKEKHPDQTPEMLCYKYNPVLSERSRFYFPMYFQSANRSGTHINRAMYCAILRWSESVVGKKIMPVRSTQLMLGHESMSSSLHYMYVELKQGGFAGHTFDVPAIGKVPIFPHRDDSEGAHEEMRKDYRALLSLFRESGAVLSAEIMKQAGLPTYLME